jgi:hypothetical protein
MEGSARPIIPPAARPSGKIVYPFSRTTGMNPAVLFANILAVDGDTLCSRDEVPGTRTIKIATSSRESSY